MRSMQNVLEESRTKNLDRLFPLERINFVECAQKQREFVKKNNSVTQLERRLRIEELRRENDSEVCEYCAGTGTVTDFIFDIDSHQYQPTGSKKCICQIVLPEFDNQEV